MRISILGVGHLAIHLVPGLAASGRDLEILLSPRNEARSKHLHETHGLEIAADNADLVSRADLVLLAVRPTDAFEAIRELPWRAGQKLVSLCAGVEIADLSQAAAPARVIRAMPVLTARFGCSPTSIFPHDDDTVRLFEMCGSAFVLENEHLFDTATAMVCHSSALLTLIDDMAGWCEEQGFEPDMARRFSAEIARASAEAACRRGDVSLSGLVDELTLPGSVTAAAVGYVRQHEAGRVWREAAEHVLAKLTE